MDAQNDLNRPCPHMLTSYAGYRLIYKDNMSIQITSIMQGQHIMILIGPICSSIHKVQIHAGAISRLLSDLRLYRDNPLTKTLELSSCTDALTLQ